MVSGTFHQILNNFSNWNVLYAVLFEKQYIKSRTFNDKNRRLLRKLWSLRSCFLILPPGALLPRGLKVRWSVTWANIGVPSSDVPAEVDLLHMRIERHVEYRLVTILRSVNKITSCLFMILLSTRNKLTFDIFQISFRIHTIITKSAKTSHESTVLRK